MLGDTPRSRQVVVVSDDDWFERALREDDDDSDSGEDATEEGSKPADDVSESKPPDGRSEPSETPEGSVTEEAAVEGDSTSDTGDAAGDTNSEQTAVGGGGEDSPMDSHDGGSAVDFGNGGPSMDSGDNDSGGDGSPFSQDFASALENAPDPDSGQPKAGGPDGQDEGGTPFGGAEDGKGGGGGPFGGAEGGESSFGGGGDNEFGFGDFSSDEPESFNEDESDFDSNLERLDIGVDGLDQMILGGIPKRSLMVAIGSAGTGKTTFGLQFLNHGLQQGENAVYITLEESFERIISTADEKGWGFGEYVDDNRLAVLDIDPIEMSNSLDSIQNDLPELIEDFGADRLVLDSVSLLEMMYESAPQRRSQVFGFARALKEAGITILLTSEADRNHAYASRYGIVEYLADAVFVLRYVRPSDFRETRLAIEIQKIRDANHSRETKPYDLTDDGINVYRQANIF